MPPRQCGDTGTAPTSLEDAMEAGVGSGRCNTTQVLPPFSSWPLPPVTGATLEHVTALRLKGAAVGEEGSARTPWRKVERKLNS